MQESTHTQGLLTVDDWQYKVPGREHVPVLKTETDAIAEVFPLWHETTDRDEERAANAERLAACWNACEGIDPAAVPALLAACEEVASDCKEFMDAHDYPDLPTLGSFHRQLTAAIAKARG